MLTNHPHISIRQLENVLGFTRQGYYQYWQRQAGQVSYDADILQLVRMILTDHPSIEGTKALQYVGERVFGKGNKDV